MACCTTELRVLEEEIKKTGDEINAVGGDIKAKITDVASQLEVATQEGDKQYLRKKEEQLHREEEQLRTKEEQLHREKEQLRGQLREKEQLLMKFKQLSISDPSNKPKQGNTKIKQYFGSLVNAEYKDCFLSFEHHVDCWPSLMFVRDCYQEIHNLIHGDPRSSDTIVGNPGIGKSYFSLYELYRLLPEGEMIVYESVPWQLYLLFDNSQLHEVRNIKDRPICVPEGCKYYLYDAGTVREMQPKVTGCKAIVFSSPDKRNYIDFYKTQQLPKRKFYMPVWSLEELESASPMFPNATNVEERYRWFGGIPRYVFHNTECLEIDSTVDSCPIDSVLPNGCQFFSGGENGENYHQLFRYEVDTTTYSDATLAFASPYVVEKYYECWKQKAVNSRLRILTSLGRFDFCLMQGQLFELWAHKRLVKGGIFQVRQLGTRNETNSKLELPEMTSKSFSTVEELKQNHSFTEDVYLQPTQKNFVPFDSLSRNNLFQFTVATEHLIQASGLDKTLEAIQIPDTYNRFNLYFVVPPNVFIDLKEEQKYVTKKKVAEKIPPHVQAVKQYALCLPMEYLPD